MQQKMLKKMVQEVRATVVHQPTPVSPMLPSLVYDVGVPVIIGPMNGGMQKPKAFQSPLQRATAPLFGALKILLSPLHLLLPGKRRAAMLLVANERTRSALPKLKLSPCEILCENAVDLREWSADTSDCEDAQPKEGLRLAFVGRLLKLKAIDLLLEAMARARTKSGENITLDIVGDGPARLGLEALTTKLGLEDQVTFHGHQPHRVCRQILKESDAFAFPSLQDCGGAVVLEAMAVSRPVIATAWGGPQTTSTRHVASAYPRAAGASSSRAGPMRSSVCPATRASVRDWGEQGDRRSSASSPGRQRSARSSNFTAASKPPRGEVRPPVRHRNAGPY